VSCLAFLVLSALIVAPALAAPKAAPAPPPPPPDPAGWWSGAEPAVTEAQDPLGGRRAGRGGFTVLAPLEAIEASYHRLWGLPPLQAQIVRGGESVIELWMRPDGGQRQAVIRVVNRDDGRSFLQARAGIACCRPEITRRIDIDVELEASWAAKLANAADDEAWVQSEDVYADEGGGALEPVCVGGSSWDLYRVTKGKAVHLRRDCGGPEVGSVAGVLEPVIGAALGRDPRFDLVFPKGADFASQKAAYKGLLASGGKLSVPVRR
jgi:hypothetical protein